MMRRFTLFTLGLTAATAFLIGLIVAGSLTPTPASSDAVRRPLAARATVEPALPTEPQAVRPAALSGPAGLSVNFADIAERINPAVVNIDATSRNAETRRTPRRYGRRTPPDFNLFDGPPPDDPDPPRRGAGSGFLIDPAGYILTNHHVIDEADRITVKLSDGRSLRASVAGADPATDIALLKVDSSEPLPSAPLGDSGGLRVGEWVCAIGNPLAYEHTVTVGVVSYIGRKLFDASLDNYIQTDAAINFGNSGGPLINTHGEVIGINSAISWRASNIGFAVPINQATAILPQLKARGRVSRGFMGVTLKDVDPDLRRSLKLTASSGALVVDVAADSPGERAGLRPYDLILSVDGEAIDANDDLIRKISARQPGSVARLRVLRDGREQALLVKLAERPQSDEKPAGRDGGAKPAMPAEPSPLLGLSVRELDRETARRFAVPPTVGGVLVTRVEPTGAGYEAGIERGSVILEINRQRVGSEADYRRLIRAAKPGDILAVYLYVPGIGQRALRTIRVDAP